jgi:acetyl/propionyl-CoA carboxylase alpha subunit
VEVAAGGALPFSQNELLQTGHAIECRICAEDPAQQYLPSTGRIECFVPPLGANLRVDSGVGTGSVVSVHYDPLLAKLIVWGRDRSEALTRMDAALERFVILGVTTNLGLLRAVIGHPDFAAGRIDTSFLSRNGMAAMGGAPPDEAIVAAALALGMRSKRAAESGPRESVSPWHNSGSWRAV